MLILRLVFSGYISEESRMITAVARRSAAARASSLKALASGQRQFHNGVGSGSGNRNEQSATVAVSSSPSSPAKKGFLASLFAATPPALPPLYEPLPGIVLPPPLTDFAPGKLEVSTLPNGVRIASEAISGPTASVGVFINSGSIYETPETSGSTLLLEGLAFKSTANRSHFRLVREIEAIGANVDCSASREQTVFSADVIKTFVPEALELLADSVRNSVFNEWEVKEQVDKVRSGLARLVGSKPDVFIHEALHGAAYVGSLANPLFVGDASLSRITGESLFSFVSENFTAPRIVVAGTGVDHEELKASVDSLFGDLPAVPLLSPPPSKYVGGDWRMAAENSQNSHVALAFEFTGGWSNAKDIPALFVLQSLLGGGASFSAGGPGKGMYSRLYRNVLSKEETVETCSAFMSMYDNSGVVGIYGTTGSEHLPKLVDVISKQFLSVAQPGSIKDAELERAKNQVVSSVLMSLESRAVAAEDIGRQLLTYGHRKPTSEFLQNLKALTASDIANVASKLLKTPLTMATFGDVVNAQRFDQIATRFG